MNRQTARWSVLLLSGMLAGCNAFTPHARQQLMDGNAAYERGDFRTAHTKLDAVISECPSAPESAEAYYIRGRCHQKEQHRAAADSDMRRCIGLSKRADLTARAQACLGHLCFEGGNFAEAADHYAAAMPLMGEEAGIDEIRLRYGICLQRLGKWDDARQQFSMILHRTPNSPFAEEARRRFSWTQGAFAIQCGAFQSAAQADSAIKKLKAARLDARRSAEARSGQPLYVVYVGHYSSYPQAQAALPDVRRVVPDALIVP